MIPNNSPWLHQLERTRPLAEIDNDHHTEIAIIGGGIAGVATAYYALKNTNFKITLIEADKIAHGATGHNGGFLATYFERSFSSIVDEFGMQMAAEGQKAVDSAWDLLEDMRKDANMQTPMWQFIGYAACATFDELIIHLHNNLLREEAGLAPLDIFVAENYAKLNEIPEKYQKYYKLKSHEEIIDLTQTTDKEYFAVLCERKGCMNSAAFCEELITHLLKTYEDRFTLAENTKVRRLVLKEDHAILDISKTKKITSNKVILCTNGFENINIVNPLGKGINSKFHHMIKGIVGYMAGYTEDPGKPPTEIGYLAKDVVHTSDIYSEAPYFYLTRRPFESKSNSHKSLISIGGPETLMDNTNNYKLDHSYPKEALKEIDDFLQNTYAHEMDTKIQYQFLWHGLMGFTPNGIRLIGPEPRNPILYYNLGCNGVGLMPSIYGGMKISKFLLGEKMKSSIFDPKDSVYKRRGYKPMIRKTSE